MTKLRHVIGISGGKDSAALAIHLRDKYPKLELIYYFCDTGKELDETYQLIESLEGYLGKPITKLESEEAAQSGKNPFDFYYNSYKGYLPNNVARWCTRKMKLEPFEKFVGDSPAVSYVGIRGDEDREGYISTKSNIQSIFPFRKNIWSEEVITSVLSNSNRNEISDIYATLINGSDLDRVTSVVNKELRLFGRNQEPKRTDMMDKLDTLLYVDVVTFNHVVFKFLKTRNYPLSFEEDYPLLNDGQVLVRDDIFKILRDSGVGVPGYYEKLDYEVNGEIGQYARSRSGCYFCFFQQKIEWVWLYEQHPDLYQQAMEYENEKEGFTWNQHESLQDLLNPRRMKQIKADHLKRMNKEKSKGSKFLIDILDDTESEGCTACFI
ncbi:phosphoadenosine phosphosulfate reductase family protein [Fulvivirgaceae bacterium BMA12]|uniref:Phosphoadenosine phosphosulfate reductase family protein n=1 Tax=Agaribacillus aureus TaxID=3051825 RepID=A0ABT8L691_9BACT|nr:phosphoadenosine phosphosulfate reductase family protein [Fulvivirgaceae bacterium BMA12]